MGTSSWVTTNTEIGFMWLRNPFSCPIEYHPGAAAPTGREICTSFCGYATATFTKFVAILVDVAGTTTEICRPSIG